jgi:hypothetical protein
MMRSSTSASQTSGSTPLEHFRFSSNRENALSFCFHAIPGAKPLLTFAGIALSFAVFTSDARTVKDFPPQRDLQPSRSAPIGEGAYLAAAITKGKVGCS